MASKQAVERAVAETSHRAKLDHSEQLQRALEEKEHEVLGRVKAAVSAREAERTRASKALERVGQKLALSAWGSIDLRPEEQVRDFLVDRVLDEPGFLLRLEFALALADPSTRRSGVVARLELATGADLASALDTLFANVVLVLAERLPKRRGQTLLHAAAHDGSEFAVRRLLAIYARCHLREDGASLVNEGDVDGKTALFYAAAAGHIEPVKRLLDARECRIDIGARMLPRLLWLKGHQLGEAQRGRALADDLRAYDFNAAGTRRALPAGAQLRYGHGTTLDVLSLERGGAGGAMRYFVRVGSASTKVFSRDKIEQFCASGELRCAEGHAGAVVVGVPGAAVGGDGDGGCWLFELDVSAGPLRRVGGDPDGTAPWTDGAPGEKGAPTFAVGWATDASPALMARPGDAVGAGRSIGLGGDGHVWCGGERLTDGAPLFDSFELDEADAARATRTLGVAICLNASEPSVHKGKVK